MSGIDNRPRIILFGASGKLGTNLGRNLVDSNHHVIAITRNPDRCPSFYSEVIQYDLDRPFDHLPLTLHKEDIVINCAHARYTRQIISLLKTHIKQLINIGSTRYLTKFNNKAADEVRKAMKLMPDFHSPWVMIHPTMIYGANGENNIRRIAKLISLFRIIPLPDHGKSLIQPIHIDDVSHAIINSFENPDCFYKHIHIAGPEAMSYQEFIRAISTGIGKKIIIFSLPARILKLLTYLTKIIPFIPTITPQEVERLLEDKNIDLADARRYLNLTPIPLTQGLQKTFEKTSQ